MGALVLSVASLLSALPACAGESAAEPEQARRTDGELLLREVRSRAQAEAATEARALKAECQQQIGEFIDALSELDAPLAGGVEITLEAYSEKGRAITAAYNRITSNPEGHCLSAAARGESAMYKYIEAHKRWNGCFSRYPDCLIDSIEPHLEKLWSAASTLIARARAAMERVGDEVSVIRYRNRVPTTSGAVATSVFGGALRLICDSGDLRQAAKEPCAKLRTVTAGGVAEDELSDLDEAVEELNSALGLDVV
jgi:hypothetical protein